MRKEKEVSIKVFNNLSGDLWKLHELSEKDKGSQPAKVVEALHKDIRKIYGFRAKLEENMDLDRRKPFYLISTRDRKNVGIEELEHIFNKEGWPVPKKIIRMISADARFWHKVVCDIMHRNQRKDLSIAGSEMTFKVKMSNHFFISKHIPQNEIKVNIIDRQQNRYSLVLIEKINQLFPLKGR